MSKRLEDFADENREMFDSYEPGDKVWENIEKQLPDKENKKATLIKLHWKKWSTVAAALIVTTMTVYYLSTRDQIIGPDVVSAAKTDVPPEYAQEVYYFTRLIELKHSELKKIEKEQPGLYRQFSGDINRLDSNYQALKKELPDNPNQEMLLEAMIGNLKWQIDLLNQQLTIIQKIKQSKKLSHEKTSQST